MKYREMLSTVDGIINLIEKGHYEITGTKVKFSVHSPLLKQHLEYEVRQLDGVSDGSFGKHIVTIELNTFQKLLERLYGEKALPAEIKNAMPETCQRLDAKGMVESALSEFINAFADRSGSRSADLIFDTISPIDFLRQMFRR